jgi:hypothetical protein
MMLPKQDFAALWVSKAPVLFQDQDQQAILLFLGSDPKPGGRTPRTTPSAPLRQARSPQGTSLLAATNASITASAGNPLDKNLHCTPEWTGCFAAVAIWLKQLETGTLLDPPLLEIPGLGGVVETNLYIANRTQTNNDHIAPNIKTGLSKVVGAGTRP